ncbi:adenine-specific DNA-methyltransferase [Rhizobium sp. NFR07]|uniref:site-specific DNA-methyltransferase n=1 Tax=Rhizobium sp. NFR07 TaxID=1566262 RepID=UPI0008E27A36|nr:site-specific DNA-methyltransferase [Rhizobium sp. NFR07]SFA94601.1 adenine-specific DNA-methyltransferase [Rhizobium sp. NFR07]
MDKMKMHSPDLSQDNIAKIRDLFPGCVTEARDEVTGQLRLAVDFDQLRQELSDRLVEGSQERYRLEWPGKREALIVSNAPVAKTLRPVEGESLDFGKTKNLFVEGDNLDALKLLQLGYLGAIKLIYIDPPYNTGNDFVYEDSFSQGSREYLLDSMQEDDVGNKLVANASANGRFHSDWLSFMFPRLRVARNLLKEDGVILISIDDNEVHNLIAAATEIFGRDNFLGSFVWRRRQTSDNRNYSRLSVDHEYVVAFGKSSASQLNGRGIDKGKYKTPDNDPRGPWTSENLTGLATASQRPNLHFDIVNPETGISYPPSPARGWAKSRETIAQLIAENRILWPKSPAGRPREKKFLDNLKSQVTGFSSWLDSDITGFNYNGTREVTDLFGAKIFDFPKPVQFIASFIEQATSDEDIILDFFAGSASTAHAALKQCSEDGSNRSFIMVQIAEPTKDGSEAAQLGYSTIADIAKERIRRAGNNLLDGDCHPDWNRDVGFRVLKVDTSNMQDVYYRPDQIDQKDLLASVDNIKPGRSAEDLLFQVLVDWGVDLTLPIQRETVQGKTVFFVDGNALAACFETGVTEELVKELAGREPLRVVFRDNGFVSDAVKINVEQVFRQVSPGTDVKSI